jgi:hypothetical protein
MNYYVFTEREGLDNIFDNIDYGRIKKSRYIPMKETNFNGAILMGLEDLITLYLEKSRDSEEDKNKLNILMFICDIVNRRPSTLKKYTGDISPQL